MSLRTRAGAAAMVGRPAAAGPRFAGVVVVALLVAGLAGCTGRAEVPDVPEGVSWLGWVETDGAGGVRAATALRRYSPGEAVAFYASPEPDHFVVGYGGAAFEAAAARVPAGALESDRLSSALACGAALPAPAWWLGFTQGGSPLPVDPRTAPALTAGWLEDACAVADEAGFAVELGCASTRCLEEVDVETACRARLDLSGCGLPEVSLVRSPVGGPACLEAPAEWACRPADAAPREAAVAYDCTVVLEEGPTPCKLTVYARDSERPHPLDAVTVERVTIVEGADVPPPGSLERFFIVDPEHALFGVLFGLAVTPDGAVWVSRRADSAVAASCHGPRERPATELVRVDGESLSISATAAAPPCLQSILPDPGPGVLLGAHPGPDGAWQVSRFGGDGQRIESATLPASAPVEAVWFAGLVPRPDDGALVAVFSRDDPAPRIDLVTLDLDTLLVTATASVDFGTTHRVAAGPEGAVLAGVKGAARWFVAFGPDGRGTREVFERPAVRDNMAFMDVLHHPASGESAFAISRDMTSVQLWGSSGYEGTRFYERETQAARLARWPADPARLALVGVGRGADGGFPTLLQLVDPTYDTLLPGPVVIGDGVPGDAAPDQQGRLWVTLPWTGELVRVTP